MIRKLLALALLAAASGVAAFAQVPVFGTTVDAKTGFTYQGAAPSTHTLCGNGTVYVDSANPCTSTTLFYQTVEGNGTAETQRPAWNYSAFFTVTDSASPARTNVDGAHAGANTTCTNLASATVDVYGRTTACTSGPVIQSFNVTGCAPPSSTDGNCTGTITLPVAMADTNYTPVLTLNATNFDPTTVSGGPGPFISIEITGAITTTTIPYNITCTFGCSINMANNINVIARHN